MLFVTTCDDSGRSSQVHNKHKLVLSYDPEPTNVNAHLYVVAVIQIQNKILSEQQTHA